MFCLMLKCLTFDVNTENNSNRPIFTCECSRDRCRVDGGRGSGAWGGVEWGGVRVVFAVLDISLVLLLRFFMFTLLYVYPFSDSQTELRVCGVQNVLTVCLL